MFYLFSPVYPPLQKRLWRAPQLLRTQPPLLPAGSDSWPRSPGSASPPALAFFWSMTSISPCHLLSPNSLSSPAAQTLSHEWSPHMATIASSRPHRAPTAGQVPPSLCSPALVLAAGAFTSTPSFSILSGCPPLSLTLKEPKRPSQLKRTPNCGISRSSYISQTLLRLSQSCRFSMLAQQGQGKLKKSLTILTISGKKWYLRQIKIDGTGPHLYKM